MLFIAGKSPLYTNQILSLCSDSTKAHLLETYLDPKSVLSGLNIETCQTYV